MAVQLAESKERIRQAENCADDARDESRALREQLDEAESQIQQLQQKLVDTAASCRRCSARLLEVVHLSCLVIACLVGCFGWD